MGALARSDLLAKVSWETVSREAGGRSVDLPLPLLTTIDQAGANRETLLRLCLSYIALWVDRDGFTGV